MNRPEAADKEIAASLEAPAELLPVLPELLADTWALGCNADAIAGLLQPLELPPTTTRALDLGCGKGPVAVRLAAELGFAVTGVDLYEPFVREARRRAAAAGVENLCRFEIQDLRQALARGGAFDVVVYAGLGVLGRLDSCVGRLRRAVRPGGYMVIDDGYLAVNTAQKRRGYEHYGDHDETLRHLTAHGDMLVSEIVISPDEIEEVNRQVNEGIERRAESLVRSHPELAAQIGAYVDRQHDECHVLETEFVSTVWLLQTPATGA